jgi:hypothetical protein
MANNEKKNKLNIELPEEVSEGVYSNLAVITHSPTEFVTDFIQIMPGMHHRQLAASGECGVYMRDAAGPPPRDAKRAVVCSAITKVPNCGFSLDDDIAQR